MPHLNRRDTTAPWHRDSAMDVRGALDGIISRTLTSRDTDGLTATDGRQVSALVSPPNLLPPRESCGTLDACPPRHVVVGLATLGAGSANDMTTRGGVTRRAADAWREDACNLGALYEPGSRRRESQPNTAPA